MDNKQIIEEIGFLINEIDPKHINYNISNEYDKIIKKHINNRKRIMYFKTYLLNKIRMQDKRENKKLKICEHCEKTNDLELHHIGYYGFRKVKTLCKQCHYKQHKHK